MPTLSSDGRFFGVDLQAAARDLRKAAQGIHQWPLLAWLTPAVPVRLIQTDGSRSTWFRGVPLKEGGRKPLHATCVAIELPEAMVLRRLLNLPLMSAQDVASAVALDVQSNSPFGLGDVSWGYSVKHVPTGALALVVEVALASRKQIQQYVNVQETEQFRQTGYPEIWALSAKGNTPLVFGGFGEGLRTAQAARWRHLSYGLLVAATLLLCALALTPTAQLRLRAVSAVLAYDNIASRAAPAVREREELLQSAEQLSALADVLVGRIEPLSLMERLTQALPDDTALQTVKLQNGKVTIVGLTGNSSALMQILGEQSGLRDVRAPSAATRIPGAPKESFVIEFALDPMYFGVQTANLPTPAQAQVQVQQVPMAATAVQGQASSAVAGASSVKHPPAPVPSDGGATFGGATFGGATMRPAPTKSVAPAAAPAKP